jgi:alcohol dehydrogenase
MKFDFYLPVEVLFGSGRLDILGEVAKRYGYRAIIITGKNSTKENGALERAIHSLKKWGAEEVLNSW